MAKEYSHSRLSTFEQCPMRYKFQYIDKIRVKRDGIEAFMGSRVHEVLQKLYDDLSMSKPNTLDELLEYYDKLWEENWHSNVVIVRKNYGADHYRNTGRQAIITYYEQYEPFDSTTTLGTEEKFIIPLDDENRYKLIGYIDRLARTPDGTIEIHDYKTSKRLPSQEDVDNDRQLALYQLAIQTKWPKEKDMKLIWHYLIHNMEMVSSRTAEQLEKEKSDILKIIAEIESTDSFEALESALCPWCDFQELCPTRKHIVKVESLPEDEYLDDEGVDLVNHYMAVKDQMSEAKSKLEALEPRIHSYAKRHNVSSIQGSDYKLKIKFSSKLKFPSKSEDEQTYTEFRTLLEKHGIWLDVSQLNIYSLRALIESEACDKNLKADLERFISVEEKGQITSSKLKKDEH
jgi:putative RecB family exonuclease